MSEILNQEQYEKLKWSEKLKYVKEWKCICNECKHKWHYLNQVERRMKSQETANALTGLGMCCNPCALTYTNNQNTQLNKQIAELKQCPKCKSQNVKREARYFKKQE